MSRRQMIIGLTAVVGVIGVLLIPSAGYAARTARIPSVTTTTIAVDGNTQSDPPVVADAVPQPDVADSPFFTFPPSFNLPPLNFPDFGPFFDGIFSSIRNLLNQVFGSLCNLLGGGFCASP